MTEIEDLVEQMVKLDEKELVLRLGLSAKRISSDLTRSASIDFIDLSTRTVLTRANEEDLTFGERLFKRLNANSYELLCKDPFDGEILKELKKALDENTGKAAGMLAPILVTNLGLAPAIAAIITALIIKTLANSVATTICEAWAEALKDQQSKNSDSNIPT